MGWGDAFANAYDAASEVTKAAADQAMSSAKAAADAVGRIARSAANATKDAAVASARVVKKGATAVAQGTANVVGFGARTVGETAVKTTSAVGASVTAPYRAAKKLFSPSKPPSETAVAVCPNTWAGKKDRLEQRNQLIRNDSNNPDPAVRAAAKRLAANNDAVELARLSEDSYHQFPHGDSKYPDGSIPPPVGWSVVPRSELESKGVSVDALEKAKAVVYQTPDDWPGGKKTVIAFRGTADLEDGLVDYDQAMSQTTGQYDSSMVAGRQVAKAYGTDTVVTGHSLGGGKAQAAGAVSGMGGTMFNAAGLNPSTVDGMMPDATQYKQYRTTGDPLTGSQNSPATQSAIALVAGAVAMPLGASMKLGDTAQKALGGQGMSPEMADYADKAFKAFPRGVRNLMRDGNVLPPAVGSVSEVPAVDANGKAVSKLNLPGQHSITSAVNGIEQQKTEDVETLSDD